MEMEKDFLKDYPFRFAGYGFGVAEALRGSVGPGICRNLSLIATCFVFGRTLYKPFQVSQKTQSPTTIICWTADTLLYELIASGSLPVLTVKVVKHVVQTGMKVSSMPASSPLWGASLISLITLPFLIPLTDLAMDRFMNTTCRKLYR